MTCGPQKKAPTLLAEEEPRGLILLGLVSLRLSLELKTETIKNLRMEGKRPVWPRCAVRNGEYARPTPRGDLQDPQGRERVPRTRGGEGGTFLASPLPWAEVSPARAAVREADPEPASRGGSAGNPLLAEPAGLSSVQALDYKSPGGAKTRGRADGGSQRPSGESSQVRGRGLDLP